MVGHLDHKWSTEIFKIKSSAIDYVLIPFGVTFTNAQVALFALLAYYWYGRSPALHLLTIIIIGVVLTLLGKKGFGRPRPRFVHKDKTYPRAVNLSKLESNGSMPSGDSVQSAAVGMFFYMFGGNIMWLLLPPVVMFTRIYFVCHWIGDTLIGALIGASVTYFVINYSYYTFSF